MPEKPQQIANLNISEIIEDVRDLARGAWRYRWQAIAVAWVICLVGWWLVFSMPDVYRASSRVHIDTEDSLQPLLEGMAIQSDILEDVNIMLTAILSRPTLEKIAMRSGFDLGDTDAGQMDTLIGRLREGLEIEMDRQQVLEISLDHSNADVAYAVVDVLIEIFVENLMDANQGDTAYAQEFLVKKLGDYEALLAESEARLAEFKKKNIGQMPGERGGYYARLQQEMEDLSEMNSRIKLARQRRDALELQMAGEAPVFGLASPSGDTIAATPQIALLETQLTELRLSYTDAHPDVVRIKELLESLRAEQVASGGGMIDSNNQLDKNPVYQQMKIQFSQADLELSQLLTQRDDQAQLVKQLRQKIDTIPEIEAELTRLDRNYNVYQSQHNELVGRLEKARLSEEVENTGTGMKFRMIDPPSVTTNPVGPNRGLLATAALIFAIIAGVLLAVVRSFAEPVFYSAHRLERLFDIPVIGTIKRVYSPEEIARNRMSLAMVYGCVLALIGCYGVVMAFDNAGVELVSRLTNLVGS